MTTDPRVLLCMTVRVEPRPQPFHQAIAAIQHQPGSMLAVERNPYTVAGVRNQAVRTMLNGKDADGREFTHLMFVDADVLVPPDAITRLLALNCPLASGCYPICKLHDDGSPSSLTLAIWSEDHIAENDLWFLNTKAGKWLTGWFTGVRETALCGAGCLLIQRRVFDVLGFPWFRWSEAWSGHDYVSHGEDVDFCYRAAQAGFGPILADGDLHCGHIREIDIAHFVATATE